MTPGAVRCSAWLGDIGVAFGVTSVNYCRNRSNDKQDQAAKQESARRDEQCDSKVLDPGNGLIVSEVVGMKNKEDRQPQSAEE